MRAEACLVTTLFGCATPLAAQEAQKDHAIVFELGAAAEAERKETVNYGATFAFEITPIEHWLELEVGATGISAERGTEMSVDVLFKKPWQLSPAFEFMIGIGPTMNHSAGTDGGTFWGVEGVVDLMFWLKRNVGWYIDPGYETAWHGGRRHEGLGIAMGLLIGR